VILQPKIRKAMVRLLGRENIRWRDTDMGRGRGRGRDLHHHD